MEETIIPEAGAEKGPRTQRKTGRRERTVTVQPFPIHELRIPWDDSLARLLAGQVRRLVEQRVFTVESGTIRVNRHKPQMTCLPDPQLDPLDM